jgi:hypothetical protein
MAASKRNRWGIVQRNLRKGRLQSKTFNVPSAEKWQWLPCVCRAGTLATQGACSNGLCTLFRKSGKCDVRFAEQSRARWRRLWSFADSSRKGLHPTRPLSLRTDGHISRTPTCRCYRGHSMRSALPRMPWTQRCMVNKLRRQSFQMWMQRCALLLLRRPYGGRRHQRGDTARGHSHTGQPRQQWH